MVPEPAPVAQAADILAHRGAPPALISSMTCRSREVAPMSELDLHRLVRVAQLRNGAEGVTGLMVYDLGWIFQQLEGPAEGLARICASLRRDRRHAAIEVLNDGPPTRHRAAGAA